MKLLSTYTLAFAACLAISGCASRPQMKRDEYMATTTRIYAGATKTEVLAAAERLMRLADGDDFEINYTDDEVIGIRRWSVFLLLVASNGTDYWKVRAVESAGGVTVSVQVSTAETAIGPMPTSSPNVYSINSMPSNAMPVQGNALYEIFWARMDYLMNARADWMTCDASNTRVKANKVWGANDALCNVFNMKDRSPLDPPEPPKGETAPARSGRSEAPPWHPTGAPTPAPTPEPARPLVPVIAAHPLAAPASAPPAAPAPVSVAQPLAQPLASGADAFQVEHMPEVRACAPSPRAALTAKGPGFEAYTVACANGDALAVRCEFGNCRVLK